MLSKVAWSIRAWSRLSSFLRIMVVNTCFVVRRQNEGFFVLAKRGRNPTYYTQHQQPTKRRECARTEACKAIHPEENENCLDECVSPFCFDQVYAGAERLEPGEVDPLKRSKFNHCILERVNQKMEL
ncbi:unnamed protein product [Amoebophrya sp. A120]|nr:unnamed protein product [Amoebophrya sp. A120]|eukprot:GSA120T00012733001.1